MSDDIETRPKDSNADAWHLFLSEYLDARANSPSGMTFMAVQIAEAIDEAERRGATEKLPCGHHVSCLVKSVESTNQFCSFCDVMSQRNDAEAMEERYRIDRDSLRQALDDRFAADQRAAKAIFTATGRTRGFPSVKDVVAFYMADADRLEAQLPEGMKHCTFIFKECEKGHGRLTATNWIDHGCTTCERDALRAKFERAKEALKPFAMWADDPRDKPSVYDCERARAALAKLRSARDD